MYYNPDDPTQSEVRELPVNNNQQLITDLRAAAEYLEAHPNFVHIGSQILRQYFYNAELFKEAARNAGSFTKVVDDSYFQLLVNIGPRLKIELYTQRSTVCKKVVKWECPDEGLLAMFEQPTANETIETEADNE
jgi:hypothetical protein